MSTNCLSYIQLVITRAELNIYIWINHQNPIPVQSINKCFWFILVIRRTSCTIVMKLGGIVKHWSRKIPWHFGADPSHCAGNGTIQGCSYNGFRADSYLVGGYKKAPKVGNHCNTTHDVYAHYALRASANIETHCFSWGSTLQHTHTNSRTNWLPTRPSPLLTMSSHYYHIAVLKNRQWGKTFSQMCFWDCLSTLLQTFSAISTSKLLILPSFRRLCSPLSFRGRFEGFR